MSFLTFLCEIECILTIYSQPMASLFYNPPPLLNFSLGSSDSEFTRRHRELLTASHKTLKLAHRALGGLLGQDSSLYHWETWMREQRILATLSFDILIEVFVNVSWAWALTIEQQKSLDCDPRSDYCDKLKQSWFYFQTHTRIPLHWYKHRSLM